MKKQKKHMTKEDVVYEDFDNSEIETADFVKKLDKLKNELKKCQQEKTEYLDGWQRSKADFINFKKRTEESKTEFTKYASEKIILEILPILDHFEQAFKDKQWQAVDEGWRKGIEIIYQQLKEVLKNNNIAEIDPKEEMFDPQNHDCVELIEVEDSKEHNKILEVIKKGYEIGNKIIRHPVVKVGRLKE